MGRMSVVWRLLAAILYFFLVGWVFGLLAAIGIVVFFVGDVLATLIWGGEGWTRSSNVIAQWAFKLWRWNLAMLTYIVFHDPSSFPWTPGMA